MRLWLRLRGRHHDLDCAVIDWLMNGIRQFDQDLVPPGREAIDDDRVAACVCPVPRGVIDRHVDVSDAGRHGKRRRPKYRHDVQILRAILNKHNATRQRSGKGRIEDDLRRWLVLERLGRRCSRRLPGGMRGG